MNFTHAKIKREAVLKAVDESNQKQKSTQAGKMRGTFEEYTDRDDLENMRLWIDFSFVLTASQLGTR